MLKFTLLLIISLVALTHSNSENICLKLIRSRLEETELIEELSKNMHIIKNEANKYILNNP